MGAEWWCSVGIAKIQLTLKLLYTARTIRIEYKLYCIIYNLWVYLLLDFLIFYKKKAIPTVVPNRVAFIMDGNRRFARGKNEKVIKGHESGFSKLVEVLSWCEMLDIREVTVYAFSAENFKRPQVTEIWRLFFFKTVLGRSWRVNETCPWKVFEIIKRRPQATRKRRFNSHDWWSIATSNECQTTGRWARSENEAQ